MHQHSLLLTTRLAADRSTARRDDADAHRLTRHAERAVRPDTTIWRRR